MGRFFRGNGFSVILIVILAINMIRGSELFSNPLGWLQSILLILPGIVLGITVHEWAHAFVAYKLGDNTPKLQGRVSLNPIRHIDPIGLIALLFIGFGWGKPVMVNPYAFKHSRRDNLLTDVAGITLNFIMAFAIMGIFRGYVGYVVGTNPASAFDISAFQSIYMIFYYAVWMNLVLMIFNLLPVPPLDGFGIITEAFNLRGKPAYDAIYNAGFPILIALILFNVPSRIIQPIISALFDFIYGCFAPWPL
ncbi:MAG: site-2 protease family protein [Clostridiales Family XIII bacterium]|jgi:Zn-dependent protease|nr:site-2 protease family protein [Clostridiales Family XIII bacterium]